MPFVSLLLSLLFSHSVSAKVMTSTDVKQCIQNKKRVQYMLKCLYSAEARNPKACEKEYSQFFRRNGRPTTGPRGEYRLERDLAQKYADDSGVSKTIMVTLPVWALSWVAEIGGGRRLTSGLYSLLKGRMKIGLEDIRRGTPMGSAGWGLAYIGGSRLFEDARLIGKCHDYESLQWMDQFLENYILDPSTEWLNRLGFSLGDYEAVANGQPLVHEDIRQCMESAFTPAFAKKLVDKAMTGAPSFERELRQSTQSGTQTDQKSLAQGVLCDLLESSAQEFDDTIADIRCLTDSKIKIGKNTYLLRGKKIYQIDVDDGIDGFEESMEGKLGLQTVNLSTGKLTFETLSGKKPIYWDRRDPVSISHLMAAKGAILRCR